MPGPAKTKQDAVGRWFSLTMITGCSVAWGRSSAAGMYARPSVVCSTSREGFASLHSSHSASQNMPSPATTATTSVGTHHV